MRALGEVSRQTTLLTEKERSLAFSQQAPENGVVAFATATEMGASVMVGDRIKIEQQAQLSDAQKAETARIVRDNLGQNHLQDYLEYLRMVHDVEINEASIATTKGR